MGPAERQAALDAAQVDELDVVVVGGGVVGAGVALDAVTRGLSVGLVEARDWAAGTSSRSSKLIHGGLRYLEMLDFGAGPRGAAASAACCSSGWPRTWCARCRSSTRSSTGAGSGSTPGSGVALYDAMAHVVGATAAACPRHRHLTRARRPARVARRCARTPWSARSSTTTPRWTTRGTSPTLVRTAAAYGALVANRARVIGFLREGERVVGVAGARRRGGRRVSRSGPGRSSTPPACGPTTTQAMVGERGQFHVRASKGIHLVVPRDRIQSTTGLILRTETSVLFVIPWGRHWIIGTTDTDWDLGQGAPGRVQRRHRLPARARQRGARHAADPRGRRGRVRRAAAAAGRRVRVDLEAVPRAHRRPPGARARGRRRRQVHDVPGDGQGRGRRGRRTAWTTRCPSACTDRSPAGRAPRGTPRCGTPGTGSRPGTGCTSPGSSTCCTGYGSLAARGADLVDDDPSLGEPLAGADDYLRAEIVYAASHEGARHLDDVLTRRTRISIETFDRGVTAAPAWPPG